MGFFPDHENHYASRKDVETHELYYPENMKLHHIMEIEKGED